LEYEVELSRTYLKFRFHFLRVSCFDHVVS
jgi:hypothetical protein